MKRLETAEIISFTDVYLASRAFGTLFGGGMDLIDETAAYLDGPGRAEAKKFDRRRANVYASESMGLTARLMKAATWLLLMRERKEGDMTQRIYRNRKARLDLYHPDMRNEYLRGMPEEFVDLVIRSHALMDEIRRLNTRLK